MTCYALKNNVTYGSSRKRRAISRTSLDEQIEQPKDDEYEVQTRIVIFIKFLWTKRLQEFTKDRKSDSQVFINEELVKSAILV